VAILQERLRSTSPPEPPVHGDAIRAEGPALHGDQPEVLPEMQSPEVVGHQDSQQPESSRSAADEDLPARANNIPLTTGTGGTRFSSMRVSKVMSPLRYSVAM